MRVVTVLAVAGLLAASACGGNEQAAAPKHPSGAQSGVSTGAALYTFAGGTSANAAAVDAYGDATIKHALPYKIPIPPSPTKGSSTPPGPKGNAAASGNSPLHLNSTIRGDEGYWPGPFRNSVAVVEGAVQFVEAGKPYVCSGTLMNSTLGSVVWTAGHCVHEGAPARGSGTYHRNWLFAPAYRNGKAPFGWWKARTLISVNGWTLHGNPRYDLGVAILKRKRGRTAGQVADDGQGIEWNYVANQRYWSFGYPAESPFNGEKLAYCRSGMLSRQFPSVRVYRGKVHPLAVSVSGPAMVEIKCNMTGGSSGGGWIAEFDGSHYGYLDGVNSMGDDTTMDSPYFGDGAKNLWSYVKAN